MHRERIHILHLVAESYGFLARHPIELIRVGWLPLAALFAINLCFDTFAPQPETIPTSELLPALGKISANILVQSLVAAVILVAWHRVVLLGQAGRPNGIGIHLGTRELRYLVAWLSLSVLFLVVVGLATVVLTGLGMGVMLGTRTALVTSGALGALPIGQSEKSQLMALFAASVILGMLFASYATTRLSLVLPAMATDRSRSLGIAWQISNGNGWRLVAASLLVMLPLQIGSAATARVASELTASAFYWPMALVSSGFTLLLILAAGTLLSLFSLTLERLAIEENEEEVDPGAIPAH